MEKRRHWDNRKRGPEHAKAFCKVADSGGADTAEVVKVHDALLAFEAIDPRAAKRVELKYFGALENEEVAGGLGVGVATVKRDGALARAWLHRELHN